MSPRHFLAQLAVLYLSAASLSGQSPADGGATLIHAGRIFDSEQGAVAGPRDILIVNGVISQIGDKVPAPKGARVVDLSKYMVLPGLIDAHTHLLYLQEAATLFAPDGLTLDGTRAVALEGTPLRALHGAARARTFLGAGITTVRDLGNAGHFGDVALSTAIQDGSADGPRMWISGPGLSPPGGQYPGLEPAWQGIAEEEYRIVRSPEDGALAVAENVSLGATVIKIYSDAYPTYLSSAVMEAIVAAARLHDVRVAAHAVLDASVWRATAAGVNSIEHGYDIADSTLHLMAERGTVLVPTDIDSLNARLLLERANAPPQMAQNIEGGRKGLQARLQRAMQAGVTVAAGSDMYVNIGIPQGEAAKLVLFAYLEAGMPPAQVLQAATLNAAKLLGQEGTLGVIKPGAQADLIAVEGNPLQDFTAIKRVKWVMKAGSVVLAK